MCFVHLQLFVLVPFGENIYNVLIALVCGFSSLSILNLVGKKVEPRRGLSFGEMLAITGAGMALVLWGWEMLHLFHILPVRLQP